MKSVFFRRPLAALFYAAAVLVLSVGCGQKKDLLPNADNAVSGKITYQDKPLPFGLVMFHSVETEQAVGQSQVNPDGSYRIDNLPPGEVRITLMTKTPTMPKGTMPLAVMGGVPDPSQMPKGGGPPPWHRRGPMMPGRKGQPGAPGGMPGGPGGPGIPTVNNAHAPPEARAQYEALDEKYRDPKTTNLRYIVTAGEQTHNITLK